VASDGRLIMEVHLPDYTPGKYKIGHGSKFHSRANIKFAPALKLFAGTIFVIALREPCPILLCL